MPESMIIPARFRGPPESGNGGYVAGVIAEQLGPEAAKPPAPEAAVEVTLRAPIPLDRPLTILRGDADHLQVVLGETLIAEAARVSMSLEVPAPPSFAAAKAARARSPSLLQGSNPFLPDGIGVHPICFCCGADVAPETGLHVYAAPVEGFDGVAAAWQPASQLAGSDGCLPEPVLWAALDCPGQFAYLAAGTWTGMLGRLTGRILKRVPVGQELRVIGWCLDVERSKHFAGTALFDESGELCGLTRQVWIGRRDPPG